MVVCLLLLSGLVLWFTESLPWSWRYVRYTAILIHASVALLSIGNFMIHVYMGVFAERGALNSVDPWLGNLELCEAVPSGLVQRTRRRIRGCQ